MLPKNRVASRAIEDRIERASSRLASDPTAGIDRASGATVIPGKCADVGHYTFLPTKGMSQKAVWDKTEIWRVGIGKSSVRRRGNYSGIVKKLEPVAVHGTVAVKAAECPQVDEFVARVILRG